MGSLSFLYSRSDGKEEELVWSLSESEWTWRRIKTSHLKSGRPLRPRFFFAIYFTLYYHFNVCDSKDDREGPKNERWRMATDSKRAIATRGNSSTGTELNLVIKCSWNNSNRLRHAKIWTNKSSSSCTLGQFVGSACSKHSPGCVCMSLSLLLFDVWLHAAE